MFSGPNPPFSPGIPPRFFQSPPGPFYPGRRVHPGWGMERNPRLRGGLLARIFGGGRNIGMNPPPVSPFWGAPPQSGNIMQLLRNPQSLSNFLANTQKFLNTASQISAMVQQYGPLIKNLPAIWKIYQGLKNAGENDETELETTEKSSFQEKSVPDSKGKNSKSPASSAKREDDNRKGQSVPKLYI